MALVARAELVRRAEELGHGELQVFPTKSGARWVCQCACGWGSFAAGGKPTVTAATQVEAVKRLQHHLWRALEDDRRRRVANGGPGRDHRPVVGNSGVSLPHRPRS
jgi:hypothetical protein